MALNAKKVTSKQNDNSFTKQPPLEPGGYPGRVVQIIDLGLQPQRAYQGQDKPPAPEIRITYELVDAFMVDEEGNDIEDKPRWVSEDMPFRNLLAENAKSTKRYNALDPSGDYDGDFSQLIGAPAMITIVQRFGKGQHQGKVFENVGDVQPIRARDAARMPELKNDGRVFSLDEPDLDVFLTLPEFLQNKIKSNLEFEGSALQKLLQGHAGKGEGVDKGKAKKAPQKPVEEELDSDEDEPWV